MCSSRSFFWEKHFSHVIHLKQFSSECVRQCNRSSFVVVKDFLQIWHATGSLFEWTCLWARRFKYLSKDLLQNLQMKERPSLCVIMCIRRCWVFLKVFKQISHVTQWSEELMHSCNCRFSWVSRACSHFTHPDAFELGASTHEVDGFEMLTFEGHAAGVKAWKTRWTSQMQT